MPKVKDPLKLILFVGICLGAGIIGSVFTTSAIPVWYASLFKPSFSPPNFLFGPVWTALYILMGVAVYLISESKGKKINQALGLFWFHLGVNVAWSYLFFGLRNPFLGFVWIVFLWFLIVAVAQKFYKINKQAAYLLLPYLAWVSFATYLNFSIWRLNP